MMIVSINKEYPLYLKVIAPTIYQTINISPHPHCRLHNALLTNKYDNNGDKTDDDMSKCEDNKYDNNTDDTDHDDDDTDDDMSKNEESLHKVLGGTT